MRRAPRPSLRALVRVAAALLAGLAVFAGGVVVGGHPVETGLTRLPEPLRDRVLGQSGQDLSAEVLDVLEQRYYREIDTEELARASVEAVIAALEDPFTEYLDPDELRALRAHTEGAFFGVGLTVEQRRVGFIVTGVIPESPAAEAGLRAGDRIVSVDGRPTGGQQLGSLVAGIRGPEGTLVRLGIDPAGAEDAVRVVELRRERFRDAAVRSRVERVRGEPVGYLRLLRFTEGSGEELRRAVEELKADGVGAFVLDLRGDPGGLVQEAREVVSVFVPDGTPVLTTEGRHSPERTLRTEGRPVAPSQPLVVLMDGASASSSEIVAGALRDTNRARLVGTRSFGKALVQVTRPLRDGGALKLTTARYLTPDGHDVSAEGGLRPDVRVVDDLETPLDEALQRALRVALPAT